MIRGHWDLKNQESAINFADDFLDCSYDSHSHAHLAVEVEQLIENDPKLRKDRNEDLKNFPGERVVTLTPS